MKLVRLTHINFLSRDSLFSLGLTCLRFSHGMPADLPNRDDAFQGDSQQVPNITARFLKVTLHSGWEDFASVHVFVAEGRALSQ
jgi:hypothetical protein